MVIRCLKKIKFEKNIYFKNIDMYFDLYVIVISYKLIIFEANLIYPILTCIYKIFLVFITYINIST